MAKSRKRSSSSKGSGVAGTLRPLQSSAPRTLSTIPRFTRTPQGFVVDTETGDILGGFGRRPTDFGWAWPGEMPRPNRSSRIVPVPQGTPKPPDVPKKVSIQDFRRPQLSVCVKRYLRRKALFALGWHGRNGSGRSYRRNAFSQFGC